MPLDPTKQRIPLPGRAAAERLRFDHEECVLARTLDGATTEIVGLRRGRLHRYEVRLDGSVVSVSIEPRRRRYFVTVGTMTLVMAGAVTGTAAFVGLWQASLFQVRVVAAVTAVLGLLYVVACSADSPHSAARAIGWHPSEWAEFENPDAGDGGDGDAF
jgi:hypothetical protein